MRRPGIALMSLVLLVAGPATAADLSVMRTKAPVMAVVPNYDWSGVYLGGHLGYGWGDNNVTIVTGSPSFPVGFMQPNNGATGFIGGGQLGLNRQIGVWVLGIEGDFTGADMAGTARSISPTIAGVFSDNTSHVNWTSTVAGRLGYAWGSWLLYGKGGVAFADFTGHATTFNPNGSVRATTSGTETRTGWIAGVGLEYAFWRVWSARVEYNHMDFGTDQITRVDNTGLNLLRTADTQIQELKFGVNYHFSAAMPVVPGYR